MDQFNVLKTKQKYEPKKMTKLQAFEKDIAAVIKKHGLDEFAKMPDYILAEYVTTCLSSLKRANENKILHETQ